MKIRYFALFLLLSLYHFGIGGVSAETAEALTKKLPTDAEKKIIQITDRGLVPPRLELNKEDSSVFLYNTTGSDVDISIDFGKHRLHCHSSELKLDAEGKLKTVTPLIPSSFVIACFPEPSTYEIEVRKANGSKKLFKGSVVASSKENKS